VPLCLIVLALSLSFTVTAASAAYLPNLPSIPHVDSAQKLTLSVPTVLVVGLQGNTTPLNQPTRNEIYMYVKANPGVHFRGVCNDLGVSVGVVQYHLAVLVHAGLLTVQGDGQNKRYFLSNTYSSAQVKLISLLRHETAGKIVSVLAQEGSILHRDLARHIGISSQALTWQMNQLKPTELITAKKEGKSTRYSLNEENAAQVRQLLDLLHKSET
jgi:predicted transcriptional regulator